MAIVVAVVLLAAACQPFGPTNHPERALNVHIGPPGAGGARVVNVAAASGSPGNTAVYLDTVTGSPIASGALPLQFTMPGGTGGPGSTVHGLIATTHPENPVRAGIGYFTNAPRLNQIQVLGTHNSYHQLPVGPLAAIPEWQYFHDPLDVQFQSEGIRQIELDVWADPNGLKVFHVADYDNQVTCSLFVTCLRTIKTWSDQHRGHLPIAILVEIEDEQYPVPTVALPFDAASFDQLDAEIRSVFPEKRIITPDRVRGGHATLAEAITTDGWPTIDSVRGDVLFMMDNADAHRDIYTAGRPSLQGRVLFTNSSVGRPDAAFIKLNDPIGDRARIEAAVAAGYVVRTRADADVVEARANNTVPRDSALASGAQWVSTDFEVPGRAPDGSPYFVAIPGGTPARCNPINSPPFCTSAMLESLTP